LPAVDVQNGQAVQLVQGVAGSEKVFGDPLAAAQRWQDDGAEWIHLVDLDAAFGRGSNADTIAEIVGAMDLNVELSGGIRDDASLERALETGCSRVNIGTAALENPDWCVDIISSYGDRIAIGLDVKGTQLAARGWTREGGDVYETLAALSEAGCQRFVVTDVASDGMLTGPNLELLRAICSRTGAKVVASGGISSLADIRTLAGLVPIGVEGAIIGTALYVGSFTLTDALALTRDLAGSQL
jgi:phosphoribosylanthranilate isomerase